MPRNIVDVVVTKMLDFNKYRTVLRPYYDIILFVVALLVANYFWKFTVLGDEGGDQVTWFGMDISRPFDFMAQHIAHVVYWLIQLTNDSAIFLEPSTIHFATGTGTKIVWGCTGLKQSFIWIVIMLIARGSWKHKLWFIPLGLVCVYLINVSRLFFLTYIVRDYPETFEFWHSGVTKYLFYGLIFLMWVFWNDYLVPRFFNTKKVSN